MIEDKTKLENERNFINLLLRYRSFVEEWVDNGPAIDTFDEQYHPLLNAIGTAFSEGALLTRRRFLDFLESGLYSKIDIVSQEALFNRININVSNIKKDDFCHLRSKIIESHIESNVVSYMNAYKDNLKKGGGIFAAQKFASQLSGLVVDSENKKQAVYEDIITYHPLYLAELEEKAKRGDVDRITCGIAEIDYCMVVGFAPGTLTLFCGDVGSGKSTMMSNVAINVWDLKDKNVLVVPLEMPRNMWYQRMLSRQTAIPFDRIEQASLLTEAEWEKLRNVEKSWKDKAGKFYIMEAPERIPVSYLRKEMERHIEIFKPDLIIVDYIANLIPESRSNVKREDLQIGEMLKDLRQMGKPGSGLHSNGFAIVSGAQIGREGLKRIRKLGANKTGFYSEDLRGSHEYSADSDNIFAQQPDPNNPDSFFFYKIKTRYGKGVFPNGKISTKLRVKADIGLITGENNNWINEMKQDEVLKKLDDPVGEFDPLADTVDTDIDVPWEEEKESPAPVAASNQESEIETKEKTSSVDMSFLDEE